jgi:hypothetical protein
MSERASMPTFVPRTVASFERAATVVARRVAAPVRMLATRALSFADRLVGTWAGSSPMVGGLEGGGSRAPMRAAMRSGGSFLMPRPWYEVEHDEDTIWPQQAAQAAAAKSATAAAGATATATTTSATATTATTLVPAAERGAAIARTTLTAPPERTAPAATQPTAAQRAAAERAAVERAVAERVVAERVAEAARGEGTTTAAPAAPAATSATTSDVGGGDVRVAEALALHAPAAAQPIVAAAPVARATTPLARALAHAAWVDQQLRSVAPVAPAARASAGGYVFVAPADVERAAERTRAAAPVAGAAVARERAAAVAATPAAMPSVATWSSQLPDPRLPATLPTALAQRAAEFVSQLVGAQAERDAAPVAATSTWVAAPVVAAQSATSVALPVRTPAERTFVMLAVPAPSWRPGAAAARVEQLGAHVDARVTAAWGEPAATTTFAPATMAQRAQAADAMPAAARAVLPVERTWVAPLDATATRATGPARMSQFVQQLMGVQAARATAPLPVQALVAALERGEAAGGTTATPAAATRETTTVAAARGALARAATTTAVPSAASGRAPERVALLATTSQAAAQEARAAAMAATMMPGAIARRAEQLGGVVGVRAASLSIDFVDPARLSLLTGETPAMPTVAPAATETIMPAPRPLFATPLATTAPAFTAEEWSLVATFPSASTAVQLAAARQAASWSGASARATAAPERTWLSALAAGEAPAGASARGFVAGERAAAAPSVTAAARRGGAPAEFVAPTVTPADAQARLPGGRTPRGSFTWPRLADYTPALAEWTEPAAIAVAEQAKQAAPGTPLWGVMAPLVAVSPSLAASTGAIAARGATGAPTTSSSMAPAATTGATRAASATDAATAVDATATGGESAPAGAASRSDAPAMTLMTAAATRDARAAARMGTRDVVATGDGEGDQPVRTAPADAPRTAGVSNVRPASAMPLMTSSPAARDGAAGAAGPVGPAARALELARPFLRLVEGSVASDGPQRASAAPRFFEAPQPVVAGAPSSDSASRIVEALRSQPAATSDDRVSLADLTLIAIASATQQVAASPAGGGPSGAATAAPSSSSSSAPSGHGGASGNPVQDIEQLARETFDELLRQMAIAAERSGNHG